MATSTEPNDRRRYGQGSMTEKAPGVWRLRVFTGVDVLTNHPIQPSRTFRGTRAAAEKALSAFRAELSGTTARKQSPTNRLLLNDVLRAHLAASTWAPGTRRGYESQFRKHIEPGLGARRIDTITAQLMREYYAALAEQRDLAPASVMKIHALISGALRRAAREAGVRFDFNQLVPPPALTLEKRRYATDAELVAVFAAADELGDSWPLLLRLACATGMRRGELVALRWSSLDPNDCLYVKKGIVDEIGGSVEKPPKNGHPRYVAIDAATARLWRTARAQAREWCSAEGLRFDDERYVFAADPEGTRPCRPDRVSDVWDGIRSATEIRTELEFRALRNWHVTVLDDELGFELAKIGRRVGHTRSDRSALGMTARYSLSDRKVDAEMAAGVGQRLESIGHLPGR